jgi:transposase-like protein
MTTEERYSHWQSIIEEQKTSGTSIAAYCRRHQIQSSAFYTWRCKIRQRQTGSSRGFLELKPADSDTGIRIRAGETISIEVSRGFDPITLQAVLAVIETR